MRSAIPVLIQNAKKCEKSEYKIISTFKEQMIAIALILANYRFVQLLLQITQYTDF
jgi:hypothetical protein